MSDKPKTPVTKKIAGILRAVAGTPDPKNFTSAVICAAGSSTRMEKLMGEPRKQFMELDGLPVVARTLMAYEAEAFANTLTEEAISLISPFDGSERLIALARYLAVRKV